MRLSISKSKNSTSLYVIKSTYVNGIHEYSDGFEPVNPTRRAGQSEIESQRF
jgi:hypothetical protein